MYISYYVYIYIYIYIYICIYRFGVLGASRGNPGTARSGARAESDGAWAETATVFVNAIFYCLLLNVCLCSGSFAVECLHMLMFVWRRRRRVSVGRLGTQPACAHRARAHMRTRAHAHTHTHTLTR